MYREATRANESFAIGFFQEGVSNFHAGEFQNAIDNFDDALDVIS